MNVVKLKDIIKPNDEFFNKYLKGKYAWWVHMRYIIPFELMGVQGYIACEENINDLFKPPFNAEFRDTYDMDIIPYIDQEETNAANSVSLYKTQNRYAPDADITAEEVKQFRTWLASEILKFDQDNLGKQLNSMYSYKVTSMLEYYKNFMFDDVVKKLNEIKPTTSVQIVNKSCGCGSSDLTSLYNERLETCDPLESYKYNIYNIMVETFSDIDFWTKFPKTFILEFKKYIDNILGMNLLLAQSDYNNSFKDCTCSSDTQVGHDTLKRLSTSLEYIYNNKMASRKNFIHDSFYDWASQLYESMQW